MRTGRQLILAVLLTLTSTSAHALDCRKARTEIAKEICAHSELLKMSEEVDSLLAQRIAEADPKGKTKLKRAQEKWLRERDSECPGLEGCLSAKLRDRLVALKDPALAAARISADAGLSYRMATRKSLQYPQLFGLKNREIQKAVNEQIAAEAKEWGCPGGKPGFTTSAQVVYLDGDVFSYKITFNVSCGEHDDIHEESRTFDLNTGAALPVSKLFREELTPQAITDLVFKGAKVEPECLKVIASAPLEFNSMGEDLTFYPRLPFRVVECQTRVTIPLRQLKPYLRPGVLGPRS